MNLFKKIFFREVGIEVPPKDIKTTGHEGTFQLLIKDLVIGELSQDHAGWTFEYTQAFKDQERYRRIVGFSDLERVYRNDTLWPFFRMRIPGLKQPLVQEILRQEDIDRLDEFTLLKRFGRRSASNPYLLELTDAKGELVVN